MKRKFTSYKEYAKGKQEDGLRATEKQYLDFIKKHEFPYYEKVMREIRIIDEKVSK